MTRRRPTSATEVSVRRVLLATLLCLGIAVSANATMTCTEILMVIDWVDLGGWWFPIMAVVESCTVTADPLPPSGGFPAPPEPLPPPPPPPPVPATVAIG